MALAATDFIYPDGLFQASMFPGETLTGGSGTFDKFLAKAITISSDETVQNAYIHYRAYQAIADRLNAGLLREKRLQAEAWIDTKQIKYFEEQASLWKAKYEHLLYELTNSVEPVYVHV